MLSIEMQLEVIGKLGTQENPISFSSEVKIF
jgi:hypothetical protein